MSEKEEAAQVSGARLPEGVSIDEQAKVAGRRTSDLRHGHDDIDTLAAVLKDFCDHQLPSSDALASARTKFTEGLFWLRTHRDRG